ncbi:uncharacterized protein LOC122512238 isoform X2 [Leptopilina heterotoma]|uniref:uncharacterized protein LOC122512238 isoform X2 n=1 Tax=Leptopilina heterotoma TaxID=63436 RepID=UPI001CA840F7|nr:uncharacterized protein LOC122512238 isoform X2 [Leptopilina heterotoma]
MNAISSRVYNADVFVDDIDSYRFDPVLSSYDAFSSFTMPILFRINDNYDGLFPLFCQVTTRSLIIQNAENTQAPSRCLERFSDSQRCLKDRQSRFSIQSMRRRQYWKIKAFFI